MNWRAWCMVATACAMLAAATSCADDPSGAPNGSGPRSVETTDKSPDTAPPGRSAGPEEVVREYFEAGSELDKARTLAVICSADQEQFEAEAASNERIESYSIGDTSDVGPGLAQVTVDFTEANGQSGTVQVPVVEESDGWKVCFSEGYRLPGS